MQIIGGCFCERGIRFSSHHHEESETLQNGTAYHAEFIALQRRKKENQKALLTTETKVSTIALLELHYQTIILYYLFIYI